jgi:hypothetical protein
MHGEKANAGQYALRLSSKPFNKHFVLSQDDCS